MIVKDAEDEVFGIFFCLVYFFEKNLDLVEEMGYDIGRKKIEEG